MTPTLSQMLPPVCPARRASRPRRRRGAWRAACAVVLLAACGGGHSSPASRTPAAAGEAASSSGADTGHASEAALHAGGDKEGVMRCGGFEVPDLGAILAQASCEVSGAKPDDAHTRDMKDLLDVTVRVDPPRLAPGGNAKIQLLFHNKSKGDLPLDFVVDPEPRFELEVYTPKGARVDKPAGPEPALPSGASDETSSERRVARITLAAQGTATMQLDFHAVKYKWAPKDRAKGAVPGHGYPREPGGPLPKGKYVVRVVTPLIGAFEGSDHEVSQPRAPFEVGAF